MPKNKIPDRWLDYKPFGNVIEGTRLLPFKVPLKKALCGKLPQAKQFTPADFFDQLEEKNYELGMLIDLTATTRYYDAQEIMDRGVQYVKIFTQGHVVPSSAIIHQFSSAVAKFEEGNLDNDLVIGVHCTHGVNRTGYLICRYLIENKQLESKGVLKAFECARGHPVERENYIQSLHSLSGGQEQLECEEGARGSRGSKVPFQDGPNRDVRQRQSRSDCDDRSMYNAFRVHTEEWRQDYYPPRERHQQFPFHCSGVNWQGYRGQYGNDPSYNMGYNWRTLEAYDENRGWRTQKTYDSSNWRDQGAAHHGRKWTNQDSARGHDKSSSKWRPGRDYNQDHSCSKQWPRGNGASKPLNHHKYFDED